MNDLLKDALNGIDDQYIAEAAQPQKLARKPYWYAAIAALLALAIGLGAIFGSNGIPGATTGPIQIGTNPTNGSKPHIGPSPSTPASLCFDSLAQLQGLLDAAKKSQAALDAYWNAENIGHFEISYPTQSDVQILSDLLNQLSLPRRADQASTFVCLYYYPARFYGKASLELFYDVSGVRYCFFVTTNSSWNMDGDTVSAVTLGSLSSPLVLGDWNTTKRLFAEFHSGDWTICMWANTADPASVDLSGFSMGNLLTPIGITPPELLHLANLVAAPQYPKGVLRPNKQDYADIERYQAAEDAWFAFRGNWYKQYKLTQEETHPLDDYFHRSALEFLSSNENQVFSPLNVYMALAMLAETTDGNSRQEILDLLGAPSIEFLRYQAQKIWCATYVPDGTAECLLANSLWLDDSCTYCNETTQILSQQYFASVFHGDLGTEEMNEQLRTWLDTHTGNLLQEQVQDVELSPDAVFALASTLYFSAAWSSEFDPSENTTDTFYAPSQSYSTDFMHSTMHDYYWGEHFGAVSVSLEGTGVGSMWLILPNEGYTPQDVLQDGDWLKCVQQNYYIDENGQFTAEWSNHSGDYKVNISLPKFDIAVKNDLVNGMKNMGLLDIFNSSVSDFSPLCANIPIAVNQIDHAVRVAIDEEGVTAAAFTVIAGDGASGPAGQEEIDFILNRPFIFVITNRDGLPLFAGIVNEP